MIFQGKQFVVAIMTGVLLAGWGSAGIARGNGIPTAGVLLRAPHELPTILKVNLPSNRIHSGELVHASVITSSNVASVEARIKGYGMSLQHVGVGRFEMSYHVPWLPFFLKGNWPVNVIARNVDGVATQKVLYIKYQ